MKVRFSFIMLVLLSTAVTAGQANEQSTPTFVLALDEFEAQGSEELTNFYVVTLQLPQCGNLKDDSDLGSFIQSAIKHDEDELVLLVPPNIKQPFRVVLFRGGIPTAQSQRVADAEDRLSDIETHRVRIQRSAPKSKTKWAVEPGELLADDGTKVAALKITGVTRR
jgi:hypothetical protein